MSQGRLFYWNVLYTTAILLCTVQEMQFNKYTCLCSAMKILHASYRVLQWPFSSVAQIKLHMNQVIFEPDIRLRRTNHYKVKYLLSRETLRNSKHHVEKLYTASRLVAFNTEDVLLQPWLGIDYCVAVFLCNQLNELPDGPVQHSPTVTDPDGQNIKKAPMPWGGGVLTLPLKPSTVSWRHNINFHLSSS